MIAVALCVSISQPALARRDKGHEIIASIARAWLTSRTRAWVDALFAKDADTLTALNMVSRATWADKWRDSGHRETASWHVVDLELTGPDLKSACFGNQTTSTPPSAGPAQDRVVDKIGEFTKELGDPATPNAERLLPLKYVLHFIGDVHQPLHASDNQERGGNCVHVSLGGQRTTNLHSFWDTAVLAPLGEDTAAIARTLEAKIEPDEASARGRRSAGGLGQGELRRRKERRLHDRFAIRLLDDASSIDLSIRYQARALATNRQQIEKAAVRLAVVLKAVAAEAGPAS